MLRFITCGSVDDGKSTLIGRMLFDSKMLSDDQLETFEVESRKLGTQGEGLDFALLVDGLSAEREQGITIDVAYRFFSTKNRKFIVADTPGHEQFTRNMITGASTADLGIILVDARQGILTQTKRHSYLINLLGIKQIVLAVNKMDLVHYDRHTYDRIVSDYQSFADSIGIEEFTSIPISGLAGDNIAQASEHMSWFEGKTLLEHLDTVDIEQSNERGEPFQMSVQWVNRPNSHFRGYTGLITKGKIKQNDDVRIVPSGKLCSISEIFCSGEKREDAVEGEAVTLTFKEEVDCSRGQVIVSATSPLETSDQFESTIFWMDTKELMVGRSYWMKIGTQTVSATVQQPKFEINVNNQEHIAAKTLKLNAIGVANITTSQQIAFTSYKEGKDLGGFILVDKMTNQTAASGIINFSLRRASNIHWQDLEISREQHAAMKGQNP